MNDKIKVPHEYLPVLRALRNDASCDAVSTDEVLDALIAAAEADQPPLPKGWVAFYDLGRHAFRHLWHDGRGSLYTHDEPMAQFLVGKVGDDRCPRDLLTPLRLAVIEAAEIEVSDVSDG